MKEKLVYIFIIIALLVAINHTQKKAEYYKESATIYRKNQNSLNTQLRRIYNEKNLLQKQNEELEKHATKDIQSFNWHTDISNTSVIKRLRQN